jgi:EAL domain-containing protein (putative c-di-GMP-specific phosphodiesterase class I)
MLHASALAPSSVGEILADEALQVVFQPIVSLPSGEVVGYEALTRGPTGTELESPNQLFAAARAEGLLAELDFACQEHALKSAIRAGLSRPFTLFINVEPEVTDELPKPLRSLYASAAGRVHLAIEVTERALTRHPAELLARVADLRVLGCSVALDDVGADDRSLAMMAFLEPDVIKLDMKLVQGRPDASVAAVIHAVGAEAERSGASVLVEGVERREHAALATSMGATLAQGWYFGRPTPLARVQVPPVERSIPEAFRHAPPGTPYELAADLPSVRVATKPLLYAMTKHLERQAMRFGSTAVLLAAFEDAERMTAKTRRRYTAIARTGVYCGALAAGLEREPAPGVRGAALHADDPLAREWDVAVISPHFAGALVGLDLGDGGPDDERRFRYALTYERERVIAAAHAMMSRIVS